MPPAVSILMPTFDRLQFLPPTIESVFAQTLTDWELIIADDGSGEDTRRYLHSLADPRVRVLWMAHSGRPSVMLNAALRAARGEYVAFLDSDDVWLPRKLERQVASLRRNPARRWSCTAFALIDAAGRPLVAARTAWPAPSGWVRDHLLTDAVIATPSVMATRSLLEQVGPLDEELVMHQDGDLWLRLAAVSELDGIDEPLTLVRRHGQHLGSDIIAWRDLRRVIDKALRTADDANFAALLREQRALAAGGLARSQALFGTRADVVHTLAESAPYAWCYPKWWHDAAYALARAFSSRALRRAVRTLRKCVQSSPSGR
ncbi:MAG TPA: glycosyltransferase [Burkholderiales bacterium]|nr:glycosyltransferase [Burkholderiales bacterium]